MPDPTDRSTSKPGPEPRPEPTAQPQTPFTTELRATNGPAGFRLVLQFPELPRGADLSAVFEGAVANAEAREGFGLEFRRLGDRDGKTQIEIFPIVPVSFAISAEGQRLLELGKYRSPVEFAEHALRVTAFILSSTENAPLVLARSWEREIFDLDEIVTATREMLKEAPTRSEANESEAVEEGDVSTLRWTGEFERLRDYADFASADECLAIAFQVLSHIVEARAEGWELMRDNEGQLEEVELPPVL